MCSSTETGDYVASTRRTYQWNTNPTLSIGKLPTSNGNNYGSWVLLMIGLRSVGLSYLPCKNVSLKSLSEAKEVAHESAAYFHGACAMPHEDASPW